MRIADLPGASLAQPSGPTIWLDNNAAGWGWFVDATPWDDAEFTTPGDHGEQEREHGEPGASATGVVTAESLVGNTIFNAILDWGASLETVHDARW